MARSLACSGRFPGRFASSGLALGGDALQELRGRLVVRVLLHQLAGESMAEDGLPKCLGAFQLGVEIDFEVVGDGELVFDGFLFGGRREREWQFLVAYQIRKIAG